MRKIKILVLSGLLLASTSFGAPVIGLDGLTGNYSLGSNPPVPAPMSRTMTFAFPDSIVAIDGLRFFISGTWTPGQWLMCRDIGGFTLCDTLPRGVYVALRLTPASDDRCVFSARVAAWGGLYGNEIMAGACDTGTADFSALLGGEVTAELFCDLPPAEIADYVGATYGTVTEVHLELLGVVPVGGQSWGSTKSMFR